MPHSVINRKAFLLQQRGLVAAYNKIVTYKLRMEDNKGFLFRNRLTNQSLHEQATGTRSSSQRATHTVAPAYIIHVTTHKVGQYFKGFWLKKFP